MDHSDSTHWDALPESVKQLAEAVGVASGKLAGHGRATADSVWTAYEPMLGQQIDVTSEDGELLRVTIVGMNSTVADNGQVDVEFELAEGPPAE